MLMTLDLTAASSSPGVPNTGSAPDVDIRMMTGADLAQSADLWLKAYPMEITADETHESACADLAHALADGRYGSSFAAGSLVAQTDGLVVGVIQTTIDVPWEDCPRGPFVVELFVAPEMRGRGVGGALLSRVVGAAADAGHAWVSLRVEDGNLAAQRLYRSRGFAHL